MSFLKSFGDVHSSHWLCRSGLRRGGVWNGCDARPDGDVFKCLSLMYFLQHLIVSFLSRETGVILAHSHKAFVCASQGTVGICIGVFLSLCTNDIIMDM